VTRLVLGIEALTGQGWTGGGIYIRNLMATLATLPEDEQPQVRLLGVSDPDDPAVAALRSFPFVDADPLLRRRESRPRRLLRRVARRLLGGLPALDPLYAGLDVTYPTFGSPVSGAAPVHWVPDFQHKHLPHLFTQQELAARDAGLAALAGQRVTLVLSSEAARGDFERFCPGAAVRLRVWPFVSQPPAGDGSDPRAEFGLPDRYLYLPNQFWVHKNHITAFRALARLAAQGEAPVLVCTGLEQDHRDPEHPRRLRHFLAEHGLEGHVRMLGLVAREKQVEIFRHAALVLQPSLFEGWSTVIEDAKALGRPILASDLAVHREQLTPQASVAPFGFFPPQDDAALADAIAGLWPSLAQAPDPGLEKAALALTIERQRAAARAFLDILREAVAAFRSR